MANVIAYSRLTRVLHWSVAIVLLCMLAFGFWVESLPKGSGKTAWVQTHKSFGLMAAGLIVLRIGWKLREGWPSSHARGTFERAAARIVQSLLLILSVLMPISGIAASITYARPIALFGIPVIPQLLETKNEFWNTTAGTTHEVCAILLITTLVLHVAGAFRNHFLLGGSELTRMSVRR